MPPKNVYNIIWVNEHIDDEIYRARCKEDAEILARADKIREGRDDRIKEIEILKEYY